MGCDNSYMHGSTGPEVPLADLNVMIRLACDRCHEIETRGGDVPEWAADWWKKHQATDRRRLEQMEEKQKQALVRQQAIAKLTPAERAELGV